MTDHANPDTMPATLHAAGSPPVELPMPIADRAHPSSNAVEVHQVRFRYGKKTALDALDLSVPTGITYGLFGANGAGKSTLLRLLAGVERPQRGHASVLGHDVRALPLAVRQQIGYVAEGQDVPAWMRLPQLLAYCAPLYPAWDHALAADLQSQFALDPQQKIGGMSRGQRMKVALLCALAARPHVLFMDEPFTGLDVSVKEELVRGLLDSALAQQTTVVLATHDILEVESLVEQVGFLRHGRMSESGNLEQLRERYRSLEFTFARAEDMPSRWPAEFTTLAPVERSGLRVLVQADMSRVRNELPAFASRAQHLHDRALTLRELYFLFATAQGTGTEDRA